MYPCFNHWGVVSMSCVHWFTQIGWCTKNRSKYSLYRDLMQCPAYPVKWSQLQANAGQSKGHIPTIVTILTCSKCWTCLCYHRRSITRQVQTLPLSYTVKVCRILQQLYMYMYIYTCMFCTWWRVSITYGSPVLYRSFNSIPWYKYIHVHVYTCSTCIYMWDM